MTISTELWLVRHGETVSNEKGIVQGQYDAMLSDKGRVQSGLLARRIASISPDALYSSDLSRATETANILAELCDLGVRTDSRLREVDMGSWSNRSIEEIARLHSVDWARSKQGDPYLRRGGGETAIDVQRRMVAAIKEIVEEHRGQIVVIVSHGIAIRTYLSHFLGISLEHAYQRILLSSAGVTCIRFSEEGAPSKLVTLNDVCHLDEA